MNTTSQPQPLAPGQLPLPRTLRAQLRDLAPRLAPAITTTTVLALARIWNANGAEHSVGDAVLMTALSLGCAAAGVVSANGEHSDSLITAVGFTASGALALAGVAGYSAGLSLPLLLWVLATAGVYALAVRNWRQDKREATAAATTYALRSMERGTDLQIAAIGAQARIEVAREATAYAHQLAESILARQALDPATFTSAAEILQANAPVPALTAAPYLHVVGE
jgi:hypothetical protein